MAKKHKILVGLGVLVAFLVSIHAGQVWGAPMYSVSRSIYPEASSTYTVGTSTRPWLSGTFNNLYDASGNKFATSTGIVSISINGVSTSTFVFATTTSSGVWNISTSTGTLTFTLPSNVGFFSNDAGYLVKTNNLSDLSSTSTSRTNLGLGTTDRPTFSGIDISSGSSTGNFQVSGDLLDSSGNKYSTSTGGTPAGTSTDVQFNNGGSFGADSAGKLKYDSTNHALKIGTSTDFSSGSYASSTNYSLAVGGNILTGGGTPTATATPSVSASSTSFSFTGATSSWTIPTNVSSITITAIGAGASSTSYGEIATGTLAVTPGTTYYFCVGQESTSSAGGFCGGGAGAGSGATLGVGGGGMTWFGTNSTFSTSSVIIVAGGAGGSGNSNAKAGGNGAYPTGGAGTVSPGGAGSGGGGGTQSAGGAAGTGDANGTAGSAGQGGNGGASPNNGGGGGGGYYGGGGGAGFASFSGAGGGGGSGFFKSTMTATSTGTTASSANGSLKITYNIVTPGSAPTITGNNTAAQVKMNQSDSSTTVSFASPVFNNIPVCTVTPLFQDVLWISTSTNSTVTITASSSFSSGSIFNLICLGK